MSALSKEDLQKLKDSLPRGYFLRTVKKSGMSEKSVANFFSGKSYNINIHNAALKVLKASQKRQNSVIAQQKEMINE